MAYDFSTAGSAGTASIAEGRTDDDLAIMLDMVRSLNKLISNATDDEVTEIITKHADARIVLILSAAKDSTGNHIFTSPVQIRTLMFQAPNASLFSDGIRRASAAMAAAWLIAALPFDYARNVSIHIEKQALDDIDRIISKIDSASTVAKLTADLNATLIPKSLYFARATPSSNFVNSQVKTYDDIIIPANQYGKISIFLSGKLNTQSAQKEIIIADPAAIVTVPVDLYSPTTPEAIVAKIAEKINQASLTNSASNGIETNILASPNQTATDQFSFFNPVKQVADNLFTSLSFLSFSTRERTLITKTEVVIIDVATFLAADNTKVLPYIENLTYGLDGQYGLLDQRGPKSLFLDIAQADPRAFTLAATATKSATFSLDTFHFKSTGTGLGGSLVYRVSSASMPPQEITVLIPDGTDLISHSKTIALEFLNSLYTNKQEQMALGAMAVDSNSVTIVAHRVLNPQNKVVVDILKVPEGIIFSTGTATQAPPASSYTADPKTVLVAATFESFAALGIKPIAAVSTNGLSAPLSITSTTYKPSSRLAEMYEKIKTEGQGSSRNNKFL